MTTAPVPSERPEAPLFSDGLGDRVVAVDGASRDLLQILRVSPSLTAVPSFEFALRERTARLANFRHAYFARVRRIDRVVMPAPGLAIVSDHVEGTRLSDILRVTEERGLRLDINSALCLIRQLVPAVALLHENARDVAHGLIAPERIIVTPHARLVIVEHVLGAAVEQLQFGRERLWQELRVIVPPSAGATRFDHRADVAGIGMVALSLILGRLLRAEEFPHQMAALLSQARETSALGDQQPLSVPLRDWLLRALQLDPRRAFGGAPEALTALEEAIGEDSEYVAAPVALERFLSEYIAALLEPPALDEIPVVAPSLPPLQAGRSAALHAVESAPAPPAMPSALPRLPEFGAASRRSEQDEPTRESVYTKIPPRRKTDPAGDAAATAMSPAVPPSALPTAAAPANDPEPAAAALDQAPSTEVAVPSAALSLPAPAAAGPGPAPRPASMVEDDRDLGPGVPDLTDLIAADDLRPVPSPWDADEPEGESDEEPHDGAAGLEVAPQPQPQPSVLEDAAEPVGASPAPSPVGPPTSRFTRRTLVAAAAAVTVVAAAWYLSTGAPAVAGDMGTLDIQSNPSGVQIFVDGVDRGQTPATFSVEPGAHILELRGRGTPRVIPINVAAGAQVSQYLELAERPATGQLRIQSEPAGASVSVDGVDRGTTPATVPGLEPGDHEVVLKSAGGTVRQTVTVQAGGTASLLVPIALDGAAAPAAAGPVSGWLSVKAPVRVEIHEGGRLLGTSDSERVMIAAGRHELELVNEMLGYRESKTVQVPAGRTASLTVQFPDGTVNLNASPWAEVFIDGERVGETPIGNLKVSLGPHEVVFRHPQLGEKRHAISVTLTGPVRLSVDMK